MCDAGPLIFPLPAVPAAGVTPALPSPQAAPEAAPEAAGVPLPLPATEVPLQRPSTEGGRDFPDSTGSTDNDALFDIIANTKKCLTEKRWASADAAQPNTVEFWLRIFQVHMEKRRPHNGPWSRRAA